MVTDVFEVNASGGEPRRLTSGTGTAHTPSYSPDGRQIAYYGHEDPQPGGSRNLVLWVMQADGQDPRPLTLSLDRTAIADVPPIWDSDGGAILIGILESGAAALYAIDCGERGGSPVPIVSGRRLLSSWSSAADGTRIAFTASTPSEPPEAFTCTYDRWAHQLGGSASTSLERKLSSFNADWLANVQLAEPQEFRFKAADGLDIEGWVMPPSGDAAAVDSSAAEHSDSAPVLLNVHGGPHAFYGWGFFDEFQVQASGGYAVVYINPRGSQGYGESFATACCGDWGGADYEDLMRGLDEALRRFPFLNGSRLGVLGGSYGGFMTSWIVGHTDRFLAALSERAVNAPMSLFGTSDIGYWFEQYEVGGDPFINRDSYLMHSPLTYAQKISTPLLIMHSENDLRCPIEQAEQLYVALRLLGNTDTVFVRFPEENHELTRSGKPSRRVERFQILLDWFDHYLQNDGRVDAAGVRSAGLRAAMGAAKTEANR
jgi:dipeptidyl aminopeptidase/acylaminoacyl peptidase